MKSLTLPDSGVELELTDAFGRESVSLFVSKIMTEEGILENYRSDPQSALLTLGVVIKPEDLKRINPEDLGVLRKPGNLGPQAWAAAAVAVAVFCYPSKIDPIGKPNKDE